VGFLIFWEILIREVNFLAGACSQTVHNVALLHDIFITQSSYSVVVDCNLQCNFFH
jgi:hypothetical protein